jgi:hypothetical protein
VVEDPKTTALEPIEPQDTAVALAESAISPGATLMHDAITITFSWKIIVRIGLVWAAEYAMLALIEDSPAILKVATLICALAGLAVLQFEEKIQTYDRRIFLALISGVAVIYLGFSAYAIAQGLRREAAQAELRNIYASGNALIAQPILKPSAANSFVDSKEVDQFQAEVIAWETKSAEWLEKNFSPAARTRFLDMSGVGVICWTSACDQPYNGIRNRLIHEVRNITAIMESPVYEK